MMGCLLSSSIFGKYCSSNVVASRMFNKIELDIIGFIYLFILVFRMESTYRAWARQRRENVAPEDLDELCRELQTALGTAKWQVGFMSLNSYLFLFPSCLFTV